MDFQFDKQGMKDLQNHLESELSTEVPLGNTPKDTAAALEKEMKKKGITDINRRELLKHAEAEHKRNGR